MKSTISCAQYSDNDHSHSRKIRNYTCLLAIGWTILIAGSSFWNVASLQQSLNKIAQAEARAAFGRDTLFRRWGSHHGGVYVQTTEKTPPNPYLSHIPERDILTPSGRPLTLINPAYMTRQIYELAQEQGDVGRGHITSLKPIRPENLPDPWERKSLLAFEKGVKEISEITQINGQPHMRLMKPFITEQSCLKCHAGQGYKIGDIRGGISVSIPIKPLIEVTRNQTYGNMSTHGVIWLLGLCVTALGSRQLSRSAHAQKRIEMELHQQTVQLEEEIAERQVAQEALEDSEAHLRVVADYASNWEYWRLPNNSFAYISPSVEAVTGYIAEEFMNDPELIYNIIHPDDRELFRHHTHESEDAGRIHPIEIRISNKNGTTRWMSHVCRQVFTPDGLPWGWRASNQDITYRKLMEYELSEQTERLQEEVAERETIQEQLEQINHSLEQRIGEAVTEIRIKDQVLIQQSRLASMGEMIHNIAHQWRQPLNNVGLIIQNVQLAYDSGSITSAEMENEVTRAMEIIMHMSSTIDDFRNFFLKDKNKLEFMVNNAVTRALEFVSATLESNNILVEITADENVAVIGFLNEYSQVLLNIISNARETCIERSTADPRIHIRITRENNCSVVYIHDNCGGIPEEILPKIFDPYFTTRAPDKGTGIGLYMSKVIIEQNMNGSLTVRNCDGGAEFRIAV